MTETFTAYYAKDRAKDPAEDLAPIVETLRKAGRTPHQLTEDQNNWIFKGTIDGKNNSNSNS